MSKPRASKEQWALALGLYCRGVRHQDIVKEAGVSLTALRKKISDKGWTALRRKGDSLATRPLTLKERGELIRENLATDLQVSSEKLAGLKRSTNPLKEKDRQAVVSGIAATADKVFSWSETNLGKGAFDFELLESMQILSNDLEADALKGLPESPVIDLPESQNGDNAS